MLKMLRGPDCSEDSAASVGAEVIASLAKRQLLQQYMDSILSLIVSEIRHGRQTNQVLLKLKKEIAVRLRLAPIQCARILQSMDLYMMT